MKRIIAVLLCAVIMLTALCGCGSEKKEQERFTATVDIIFSRALELCTRIYFGVGLPADMPDGAAIDYEKGTYYPVNDENFKSIASIKAATEKVFSKKLCDEWLYPAAFEGERPFYKETDGVLYVDVSQQPSTVFGTEWVLDSIKVVTCNEQTALVNIDTIIGDEERETVSVQFVNEDDDWRIATKLF